MMRAILRRPVKRSIALTCLYYLADDLRSRWRLVAGQLEAKSGARYGTISLEESLSYIDPAYRDYVTYGGVQSFLGRVAAIGPGDNLGVALRMLGYGATEVHTIDRFRSVRDDSLQTDIYRALAERHGFHGVVGGGRGGLGDVSGLVVQEGVSAEKSFRSCGLGFDHIVSRAVFGHLYDPLSALDNLADALAPGRVMIHRIDFRDHGMFEGHHPLTFLTIREALYPAITRGAGRPNQVLLPVWGGWLRRSGLSGSLRITRVVGVEGEMAPAVWNDVIQRYGELR